MGNVIDYRSPGLGVDAAARSTPRYCFFAWWICTAVALSVWTLAALLIGPVFQEVYGDLRLSIALPTRIALVLASPRHLVLAWMASPLPGVIAAAIRSVRPPENYPPRRPWLAASVTLLLLIVALILFHSAILTPIFSLYRIIK